MTVLNLTKNTSQLSLSATSDIRTVKISWLPVIGVTDKSLDDDEPGDLAMDIYWAYSSTGPWNLLATQTGRYAFVDGDVTAGTTYYYKIRPTHLRNVETAYSNVVSGTPGATSNTIPAGVISAVKLGGDVAVLNGGGTTFAYNNTSPSGSSMGSWGANRAFVGVLGSGGASYAFGAVSAPMSQPSTADTWVNMAYYEDIQFSIQTGFNFELDFSVAVSGIPAAPAEVWVRIAQFSTRTSTLPTAEYNWLVYKHTGTALESCALNGSLGFRTADGNGWYFPANSKRTVRIQIMKKGSGSSSITVKPSLLNFNYHYTV